TGLRGFGSTYVCVNGFCAIQSASESLEVRIKGHKVGRALKECFPSRFARYLSKGALTIGGGQVAPRCQHDRWGKERVDRYVASICFGDRSLEINRIENGRRIKPSRSIQSIGYQQDHVSGFAIGVELPQCLEYFHIRVVWCGGRTGGQDSQRSGRLR